ncbi:hypothetical protein M0813_11220 [Anaeramoeba flamelloides]|uniref:B box-type domain-containing protein n=1 Tax=Anaeramoeba flamelloides TaxID=1746091 RepID=A0ABQ8ZFP1_9EUKA|nr:hypothetical protein M0813_11220 [Anaeramoeba flamelloides]
MSHSKKNAKNTKAKVSQINKLPDLNLPAEKEVPKCMNCQKKSSQFYCTKCKAYFCEECEQKAHSIKNFQTHKNFLINPLLVDLEEENKKHKKQKENLCSLHQKPLIKFCSKENRLICVKCEKKCQRKDHITFSFDESLKYFKKKNKTLLEQIEKKKKKRKTIKNIESKQNQLNKKFENKIEKLTKETQLFKTIPEQNLNKNIELLTTQQNISNNQFKAILKNGKQEINLMKKNQKQLKYLTNSKFKNNNLGSRTNKKNKNKINSLYLLQESIIIHKKINKIKFKNKNKQNDDNYNEQAMNRRFNKHNLPEQKRETKPELNHWPKSIKTKSSPKLIKKKNRNTTKKYDSSEINFTKYEQNSFEPFFQFPNDDENINKHNKEANKDNDNEKEEEEEEELEQIETSERSLTTETDENNFLFNKFQTTRIEEDENSEEESSQEIFSLIFHDHKRTKEHQKQQPFFKKKSQFSNPQKKKQSMPIPINHRLSSKFTNTNNSSESEEENPLGNEFP